MARKLEALPERKNVGAGRKEQYDFDTWFDGDPWLLVEGEDYTCKRTSFESSVRSAANRRGLDVTIRSHPDGSAVQVVGTLEEKEAAKLAAEAAEAEAVAA
jgi:hypothetical protein